MDSLEVQEAGFRNMLGTAVTCSDLAVPTVTKARVQQPWVGTLLLGQAALSPASKPRIPNSGLGGKK